MNLAGQSLKFENGQWIAGRLISCHFVHKIAQEPPPRPILITGSSALPPETGISAGVDRREAQRLRRRNQQLEEENNLLRLKVDILLDMVRRQGRAAWALLSGGAPPRFSTASSHLIVPVCPVHGFESKDARPNQTQSLPSRAHNLAGRWTINIMSHGSRKAVLEERRGPSPAHRADLANLKPGPEVAFFLTSAAFLSALRDHCRIPLNGEGVG